MQFERGGSYPSNLYLPGLESGSLSGSLSQTPLYPHADVIRGARLDGRMSAIRRFFCLFVTFDFLLASLLWLLTVMIEGNFDWYDVLQKQLIHYKISTSLIDTVIAAGCRFIILILFYGCIQIRHWFFVALTTAGSGAFIVAKIILFDWSTPGNQVLKIMQLLTSFILSWAEAWLLDIKVVPLERYFESLQAVQEANDRTRLINEFLREQTQPIGSYDCFQTPIESDDENDPTSLHVPKRIKGAQDDYLAKGMETLSTAWSILNWDKWSGEKFISGSKIETAKWSGQKIFKLSCKAEVQASKLFNVLFHHVEEMHIWNENILSARTLETIDAVTDISCQISKGVSVISSKEYILLRHSQSKGDYKVIAMVSIDWPPLVPGSPISRGSMGPSCWAIRPLNPSETEVQWLLNTKVTGVPTWILERSLPDVMARTMASLLTHCTLHATTLLQTP